MAETDPAIDQHDALRLEPLSLIFTIRIRNPALAVDDPVPWQPRARRQPRENFAHQPGMVRHAGESGHLPISRDRAGWNQVYHLPDMMLVIFDRGHVNFNVLLRCRLEQELFSSQLLTLAAR